MTNYSIHKTIGAFYVDADGTLVSGPYDTEEKAKRRIRDLKRADAKAAIALDGQIVEALKTGEPVRVDIVDGKRRIVTPAEREFINTGYMPLHNPAIPAAITETAQTTLRSVRWHGRPRNGYRPAHRANRFK